MLCIVNVSNNRCSVHCTGIGVEFEMFENLDLMLSIKLTNFDYFLHFILCIVNVSNNRCPMHCTGKKTSD